MIVVWTTNSLLISVSKLQSRSVQAWSMLYVHALWDPTELPATDMFYTRDNKAMHTWLFTSAIFNSSHHCLLVATHFTNQWRMVACVTLESAAPGLEPEPSTWASSVLPLGHLLRYSYRGTWIRDWGWIKNEEFTLCSKGGSFNSNRQTC